MTDSTPASGVPLTGSDVPQIGKSASLPVSAASSLAAAAGDELADIERRLSAIDAALERLELQSYGRCASCGGDVGESVLLADPLTTVCGRCAAPVA